jgi:uncharacterized protein
MAEYLHPGVYIEEIERGPRPIEGVPTSTAAFLGEAERGSIKPRLVTSYNEYELLFGRVFDRDKFMPYAVNGFFENGGKRGYICRLVGENATSAELGFGDFIVRAAGPGSWGTRVWANISPSTTRGSDANPIGFRLRLAYFGAAETPFDPFTDAGRTRRPQPFPVEDFDNLVVDEKSPDFYGKRLPFVDLGKGHSNEGPESSALGILVRKSGVAATARPTDGSGFLSQGGRRTTRWMSPTSRAGRSLAEPRSRVSRPSSSIRIATLRSSMRQRLGTTSHWRSSRTVRTCGFASR